MKKEKLKIQSPQGMPDILPESQPYFERIYQVAHEISQFYGFQKIDTPILEYTQLFERGTGSSTDIVEKQMYTFKTKGGNRLSLRPEFTPGLCRAYIEHGMQSLPQPVKLFSYGPLFRHEKPQAGRLRQFHQIDMEVFGSKKPIIDVEIIYIFYNILKSLGIKNLIVEINSIGDSQCRPHYKKILVRYLKSHEDTLCSDCKRRLKTNPLRVLDCKHERCQMVVRKAPQIIDHLCEECHNHFEKVLEYLDTLEIPYHLNPYLVRGLDYYTKTVFEIVSPDYREIGALVGGGRYDDLIKLFTKKDVPACGGAAGVERIVALMKQINVKVKSPGPPQAFLTQLGDAAKIKALKLMEELRKAKIATGIALSKDSLTIQLKKANRQKARYALIIGEEEAKKDTIIIKDMLKGNQKTVSLNKVVKELKKLVKTIKQ